MQDPSTIREEIERLTEKRREVFHTLAQGHDAVLSAEHARLEDEIRRLWDEHRLAKAHRRFGDREEIIRKARVQDRLDRAA